ncbi:MAG TPA: hypothetical protein VEG66_02200 [Thermoplasmata archaeon]|nr:hypothetical protein [Thermoplasmata archaeon]
MLEFTHRDRRAHRDVDRAIGTVLGISVALIGFAMVFPSEFVGILVVVALGVLGVACMGWSERMLAQYASDLRHAQDASSPRGFLRAEVGVTVGLDREEEMPPSPSPHVRRRPRAGRTESREESRSGASDADQP